MGRTARHPRQAADGGSPTGQKFEYDEENRLVTVRRASDNATLLTIKYDALGRRAESTDYVCAGLPCGTGFQPVLTRHVFDGLQTIEEYVKCAGESSWTRAREYLWGDRFPQPLALVDLTAAGDLAAGQAEVLHHLHDMLGSVVALTNASGQLVERYTYDPYGQTLIERADPNNGTPTQRLTASRYGNAFAWTGQRYDATVKLYHFLYRTYLPHLGRWGQRDPLGYVGGMNVFEYVSASPVTFSDPLGLVKRLNTQKCDSLVRRITNLQKYILDDLKLWEKQRLNPPPGTDYPNGCINQDHQRKMNDKLKELRELIEEFNKNGCGSRYPMAPARYWQTYRNLVKRWRDLPWEPQGWPWWTPHPVVDQVVRPGHVGEDTAVVGAKACGAVLGAGLVVIYLPALGTYIVVSCGATATAAAY